ncbi:MAG: cytochrome c [Candidatus Acidiferrales bacterium]|jgi:mono/diheme cytochrome c family protein
MDAPRFAVAPRTTLVVACLLLLCASARAADDAAALYKTKCAACHGADGSGNTAMGKAFKLRDLGADPVQAQTDAQLIAITTDGKGKMPAYEGKLTDDQIKELVGYIRTLKKK